MKRMLAFKRILLLILGSMIFLVGQDVFAGSGKDEPIPAGSCPATLYIGAFIIDKVEKGRVIWRQYK